MIFSKTTCVYCNNKFYHWKSQTSRKYCSTKCKDEDKFHKKFDHLYKSFEENIDEAAYLFGLILGDGHIKGVGYTTCRISIAFDTNHPKLISLAKTVCNKLKIKLFFEPKTHNHCQMAGFCLPFDLLDKYQLLYTGNKYDNQPLPSEDIVNNINFAAGLFNSDGCYHKRSLSFINTVDSISNALMKCLDVNNIEYSTYRRQPKIDKRNGSLPKKNTTLRLGPTNMSKLYRNSKFYIKGSDIFSYTIYNRIIHKYVPC